MGKRTYNSDIQRYLNLKNGSLFRGNALGYFRAMNLLGIPREQAEDLDLYDLGEMEYKIKLQENESIKMNSLEKKSLNSNSKFDEHFKEERDLKFYKWGYEVYKRKDTRATDEKRRLLSEYYPSRFGNRGKTPASDLSSYTINFIFDSMIERIRKKYSF
jgi:hypothetical protein